MKKQTTLAIFFIAAALTSFVTCAKDGKDGKDGKKAKVDVYFESFCPYSKDFIVNTLFPGYEKLKTSGILDLQVQPFGQNGYKADACQEECTLNTEMVCVMKNTKRNVDEYFPVIHCIMKDETPAKSVEKCLKEKLPKTSYGDIKKCAKVNSTKRQIFATLYKS